MTHDDLVFFDVETPNRKNDSICSIGMIRADRNLVELDRDYLLVNPEDFFDFQNISVHGITMEDVLGSPNFQDSWAFRIFPFLDGARLVAHNASFDMSVIDKALANIGGDPVYVEYADTLRLSRTVNVDLPAHKLNVLCDHYGIVLDHHNAMSDAVACFEVFRNLNNQAEDGIMEDPFSWNKFLWGTSKKTDWLKPGKGFSGARTALESLLRKVSKRGNVTVKEASMLLSYLECSPGLAEVPGYDHAVSILKISLWDELIEESEGRDIIKSLRKVVFGDDGSSGLFS